MDLMKPAPSARALMPLLFAFIATSVYAQNVTPVSGVGVDNNGNTTTFPENGNGGSLSNTYDGGTDFSTVNNGEAYIYFYPPQNPSNNNENGDGVLYGLDRTYTLSQFYLWNDANTAGGINDGIETFELRFYTPGGAPISTSPVFISNTPTGGLSTHGFAPVAGVGQVELVILTTYTRAPVQWTEVAFDGVPESVTVPTLSPWGIAAIILFLALASATILRRQGSTTRGLRTEQ